MLFDVDVVRQPRAALGQGQPGGPDARGAPASLPAAKVAYVLPWGAGAAAASAEAMRDGLKVRQALRPFTIGDRTFPAGTAILRVAENPSTTGQRLATDCRPVRRRSGRARQRLGGQGDLAWIRPGRSPQVAAHRPGVGRTHLQPVGRVGSLRAGAPVSPARHRRPRVLVRPPGSRRLRRARAAAGQLPLGARRGSRAPHPGLDSRRRSPGDHGRVVALGRRRESRVAGRPAGVARRAAGRGGQGQGEEAVGRGRAVRLRQGGSARTRAPGKHSRLGAARRARQGPLALVGYRRRDPGDGGRPARVHADPPRQGNQRRVLRRQGPSGGLGPRLGRRPGPAGGKGVPGRRAARPRTCWWRLPRTRTTGRSPSRASCSSSTPC